MEHLKEAQGLVELSDYEDYLGTDTIERLRAKAEPLRGKSVVHVNSTYYGGGVAELMTSLSLLMNDIGMDCDWRIIRGNPDFFDTTKGIHNALQGGSLNWTHLKKQVYEGVNYENSLRMSLDEDFVVIHDPQPLPLLEFHGRRDTPWFWRVHIDLTEPHRETWNYLKPFIEEYDASICSLEQYKKDISIPQYLFTPSIDPFKLKNRHMTPDDIDGTLADYDIPTDKPLITQISRFDRWKDPIGVIEAYQQIRREVDCTLVLLGNVATDDPEGEEVYREVLEQADEGIHVISEHDEALVNALQTRSAVVFQKSLREGFGLTVTEAMWKGTPVVGGAVGGIRRQIEDGENGYLVSSVDQAADRAIELLGNEELRDEMGERARRTVRENFLMPHLLERYLDLFNSVESSFDVTLDA
jgi:trehalose synthase